MTKRISLLISCFIFLLVSAGKAQNPDVIQIPDILGYQTITLDPHLHTVFSDGLVWPTIRVEEAWREGIDAISLSEHIEYRPFQRDVVAEDYNRAYDVATPAAERRDVLLIRGNEITRSMPPGHFNALFLEDSNKLAVTEWRDAFRAARDQGAFLLWNHPGWNNHQPGPAQWHDEHTWLLENDMLHGIEVINGLLPNYYSPEAHQWCLDYGLAIMGSSDAHNPMAMDIDFAAGERRALTLVFAKERSLVAIKEAMMDQRTAAYFDDLIAGREEHLMALFQESLTIESVTRNRYSFSAVLRNHSDIPIKLTGKPGANEAVEFFHRLTVPPLGTAEIYVSDLNQENISEITIHLIVENFLSRPGEGMPVQVTIKPD
jgi:3',5'-nucleoside bisphosphate phosphatase